MSLRGGGSACSNKAINNEVGPINKKKDTAMIELFIRICHKNVRIS